MSDPYIGEIRAVGFNFAPVGWASCNGQTLSIADNEPLYALIGTTYGGDGMQTFGLPDLRGRLPVGSQGGAAGTGLSPYPLGAQAGTENVTLNTNQLPAHQHPFTTRLAASNSGTATTDPKSAYPGSAATKPYSAAPDAGQALQAGASVFTVLPAGNSQTHSNLQPVLAMNYIIALYGIFPSQP